MYKGLSKQGDLVNFQKKKLKIIRDSATRVRFGMQSFNTEQVLWPSYMSLKIGLYKWKHWHNLHYSIANRNAILYNLNKNVFLIIKKKAGLF